MNVHGSGLRSSGGRSSRRSGNVITVIGARQSMPKSEVLELFRKWRVDGDMEAANTIAATHLKFIISEAHKLRPRSDSEHFDFIHQALDNLMDAMLGFDWERGVKFTTYLVWFIRKAKNDHRSLFSCPYKIPEGRARYLGLVQRTLSNHFAKTGHWLTLSEVANDLGMTVDVVRLLYNESRPAIDVDAIVGEGTPHSWTDEFEATGSGNTDKLTDYSELLTVDSQQADGDIIASDNASIVDALMSQLEERKQKILQLRFGLGSERVHTLQEVGDILGISRERVRQIESESLKELRLIAIDTIKV